MIYPFKFGFMSEIVFKASIRILSGDHEFLARAKCL